MAAREPLPEARRADPRDRSRAGHDRGHRARHRFRAGLPRLAALPRPADPGPGRHEGVDRVGPPDGRGHHRVRDPRARAPGRPRPSRSALDPVAVVRRRRARRLPGLARTRDGPAREQRRVGHRAPRRGARARRAARLPDGPCRLPGADRRSRRQPALHAARRVHDRGHLRAAAVRIARDRHGVGARLPGLAADERLAPAGPDRCDRRARPPSLGGGAGRAVFVVDPGGRRVADPARPPDARPAGRRFGGPVRDPGRDRRRPGPDPARRVDPDAAPRARRRRSGRCSPG